MKLLFLLSLFQFAHDFRNFEGQRICKFCHIPHNSKGPYLINLVPFDEIKEKFKEFDYVSLTCMNCHTHKNYLLLLYPEVQKFYNIPDTSPIFLGDNYENHHPVGDYVSAESFNIKCTTCHDPHKKNMRYLLRDETPEFCEKCHRDIEIFSGKHAVLNCIDCHKLHKGKSEFLVKKDVCNNCHGADVSESVSKVVPFDEIHFGEVVCKKCHNPHKPEVIR